MKTCGRNFLLSDFGDFLAILETNQQSYGQMDITAGFSRSERSRNNLGRNSNCSGRMFHGREKWIRQRV
jgi:hypothetical protein